MSIVKIEKLTRNNAFLIPTSGLTKEEYHILEECLRASSSVWLGFVDEQLVCAWGLIPPSLISHQACLWLLAFPALAGNEFVFIRQSQIAVQEMLKRYPRIYGYTSVDNPKAIRWLRWLGASFRDSEKPGFLQFIIAAKKEAQAYG